MEELDFVENLLVAHIYAHFCWAKREVLQMVCLGQIT